MPRHPALLLPLLLAAGQPVFGDSSAQRALPPFSCEPPARVVSVRHGPFERRSCVLDTPDGQVWHGSQQLLHDGVVVQSGEMRHGKREGVWRQYDTAGRERRRQDFVLDVQRSDLEVQP
jgi:hypothetical protein